MKKRIFFALISIILIVLLDQTTKYFARVYIHPFETIEILPVLNLVNVRNEGAAFGMFRSLGNAFFTLISLAALVFLLWIIVAGKENYKLFALLAGGAAGNLIDRIMLGYVVDFIDITVSGFHWPAFNVADSALTIGIVLLMFGLFKKGVHVSCPH
ncbi:MAG: signal peptidase II [Nitrospirota bacterium]